MKDKPHTISFRRRNLPHWIVDDRTLFVTIRKKGTLPAHVVEAFTKEKEALEQNAASPHQMRQFEIKRFKRVEEILDSVSNEAGSLTDVDAAPVIMEGFNWLEAEKGWHLLAATVMPSHIHLLLNHPQGKHGHLNTDLGVFKGYSSRLINKQRATSGSAVWSRENFDHWCRNQEKVESAIRYIANNPVKAGLIADWQQWPWTKISPKVQRAFLPA